MVVSSRVNRVSPPDVARRRCRASNSRRRPCRRAPPADAQARLDRDKRLALKGRGRGGDDGGIMIRAVGRGVGGLCLVGILFGCGSSDSIAAVMDHASYGDYGVGGPHSQVDRGCTIRGKRRAVRGFRTSALAKNDPPLLAKRGPRLDRGSGSDVSEVQSGPAPPGCDSGRTPVFRRGSVRRGPGRAPGRSDSG